MSVKADFAKAGKICTASDIIIKIMSPNQTRNAKKSFIANECYENTRGTVLL